ncbi:hypothetical protein AH92_11305 [Salmonella enterica subsp. enterica serovar Tennessee]|nr:GNAT family N-acetyltransferase [Salmonella enterica]KWQ28225.1 hypothetical protein AH92_11305 [Salmonella enterica subsp. enterica serovar Tennessee]KWQ64513.1 hypothetical protein AH91_20020 [Salmonella enterica subsp. enterica serovar Tennessee]
MTNALSQPETTYWLQHVPYPYTSSDSAAWITKHPQSWHLGISLELAIEEKTTQQLAGTIGLFELTQEKTILDTGWHHSIGGKVIVMKPLSL